MIIYTYLLKSLTVVTVVLLYGSKTYCLCVTAICFEIWTLDTPQEYELLNTPGRCFCLLVCMF